MSGSHLAQLTVGRLRHPIDAPESAGLAEALDEINEVGEATREGTGR